MPGSMQNLSLTGFIILKPFVMIHNLLIFHSEVHNSPSWSLPLWDPLAVVVPPAPISEPSPIGDMSPIGISPGIDISPSGNNSTSKNGTIIFPAGTEDCLIRTKFNFSRK